MPTVTIEDSDTSGALLYGPSDAWQTTTAVGHISGTVHLSKEAYANVTLSFVGTEVSAKGGLSEGTQVAYVFDDSAVTLAPANPGHPTLLQVSSQPCAEHSLTLITQPDQHLFVDNFEFVSCTLDMSTGTSTSATPPSQSATPTPITSNNVAPVAPSASTMTSDAMMTGSIPVASAISASLASNSSNGAVIAGVTVSVLAILALLAAGLFFCMRRRGTSCCGWRKKHTAPSAAYLSREKSHTPTSSYGGILKHQHTDSTTHLTAPGATEPSIKYIGDVKVYDGGYDFASQGQSSSPGSFLKMKRPGTQGLRVDTSFPWRSPSVV